MRRSVAPQPLGRRERNKQAKLERITAAARELFAEHGVDEVTTQQIADAPTSAPAPCSCTPRPRASCCCWSRTPTTPRPSAGGRGQRGTAEALGSRDGDR